METTAVMRIHGGSLKLYASRCVGGSPGRCGSPVACSAGYSTRSSRCSRCSARRCRWSRWRFRSCAGRPHRRPVVRVARHRRRATVAGQRVCTRALRVRGPVRRAGWPSIPRSRITPPTATSRSACCCRAAIGHPRRAEPAGRVHVARPGSAGRPTRRRRRRLSVAAARPMADLGPRRVSPHAGRAHRRRVARHRRRRVLSRRRPHGAGAVERPAVHGALRQ